jgi:uncharacterized protein YgiM (DUF1202 family)
MKLRLLVAFSGLLSSLSVSLLAKPAMAQCKYAVYDPPSNVRSGPGNNYKVIGSINHQTSINIVSNSGAWLRTNHPINGWIHNSQIHQDCSSQDSPRYPYTVNAVQHNGGMIVTVRQTPTWAKLTKSERKSIRENIWYDYLESGEWQHNLVVNFYTSAGYNIASYSTGCNGRCFTKE